MSRALYPLLALLAALLAGPASASTLLQAATDGRSAEVPRLFEDGSGRLGLAAFRNRNDGPGEIALRSLENGAWSSPALLEVPGGNLRMLQDATTLTSGRPMAVLTWDPTDYVELLGLHDEVAGLAPEDPFPYPADELFDLMGRMSRVHFSVEVDGRWTAPLPVHGTRRARAARLVAGPDDSALLLVLKDEDEDPETAWDIDLYAAVWQGDRWSEPARLTDNDVLEVGAQALFAGGVWTVAWGVDGDSSPETAGDKEVLAVQLSADGLPLDDPTSVSGPFEAPMPPNPLLVIEQGAPAILWLAAPLSLPEDVDPQLVAAHGPARPLVRSRLAGSWSEPTACTLRPTAPLQGLAVALPDGEGALVIRQGTRLVLASSGDDDWHAGPPLFDSADEGFVIQDWDALVRSDGVLHLAVTGRTAPGGGSSADPEALRHDAVALEADLGILAVSTPARRLEVGDPLPLIVTLNNDGRVATGPITLQVDDELFDLPPLQPGRLEQVEVELDVIAAGQRVAVVVLHDDVDADPSDDALSWPVPLLPDYQVRRVWIEPGRVVADVRETVGLQSAPVPVSFRLETDDAQVELGQAIFDPRDARPVSVQWPGIDEVPAPLRVVVQVNAGRAVAEGDYTDNVSSFQDLGLPDFTPTGAAVEEDGVRLEVRASGRAPTSVDVLLSGSPEEAAASLRTGWAEAPDRTWTVELDESGSGVLRAPLPVDAGLFVWAVANPGQAVPEASRNDNILRFSRHRRARASADLVFAEPLEVCGVLTLAFENRGEAPSLAAYVTLVDSESGLPRAERTLPVAEVGGRVEVSFDGLEDRSYRAVLRRPDRPGDEEVEIALDFVRAASLDVDGDGFAMQSCGGDDCDDGDAEAFPGSADLDELCQPKVKVGCGRELGCAAGAGRHPVPGLLVLVLLAVGIRRRSRR